MKIAVVCAVIFFATSVGAKTIIIEYPDHYYVESTGIPGAKPAQVPDKTQPSLTVPVTSGTESAHPATTSPVTDFAPRRPSLDPVERRASMNDAIRRLQIERNSLMIPIEGESSEQSEQRQQNAAGILRKLNKISSELLKMP